MDTTIDHGRREFLKAGAALGAGLTIAFYLPSGLAAKLPAASDLQTQCLYPRRAGRQRDGDRQASWRWARASTPACRPWWPRNWTCPGTRSGWNPPRPTPSFTTTCSGARCREPAAAVRWPIPTCSCAARAPRRAPCWSRRRRTRGRWTQKASPPRTAWCCTDPAAARSATASWPRGRLPCLCRRMLRSSPRAISNTSANNSSAPMPGRKATAAPSSPAISSCPAC